MRDRAEMVTVRWRCPWAGEQGGGAGCLAAGRAVREGTWPWDMMASRQGLWVGAELRLPGGVGHGWGGKWKSLVRGREQMAMGTTGGSKGESAAGADMEGGLWAGDVEMVCVGLLGGEEVEQSSGEEGVPGIWDRDGEKWECHQCGSTMAP